MLWTQLKDMCIIFVIFKGLQGYNAVLRENR